MVSLFKDRSPATIIWLFLLSIFVHSHFFIAFPPVVIYADDGLISNFLQDNISGLGSGAIILIYHIIVLVQALRLNYLFTDHRMYSKVNYLVAMVYVLLTGIFTEWSSLTPALIANSMIIWLFAKTVTLYNSQDPKTLLFNIGLIIGVTILLYHPSALLILVAYFALMVVRPFVITEWLVLPMGIICPFYFLASYLYLTDRLKTFGKYIPDWQFNLPQVHVSPVFFATLGVIVIVLLIGLFYWQEENRRLLIQVRKNWIVLMVLLFVLLPVPFINKNAGIESLLLWIVPAGPFMAKGFLGPKKNTVPVLMFWVLLALSIVKNWHLLR